jgi:MFS transporter, DHA2 family, multidrug resistance protein
MPAAATPAAPEWRPKANPWVIAAAVMAATFMEVLDTSVANVALPHIAGSLSATTDEATWVLTSYLVSNAIVLPATGWCSRYFGRRRFLITCIVLFTAASALCGVAGSLGMLIAARTLQGIGGGALQPVSQAVLLESFPIHKRGQAMAVFAMGVVVAPILGPTLGGWITDNYSWRWIFYINLPIGAIAVAMCAAFLENPPFLSSAKRARIDFAGLALLGIWIAALQFVLDRGQQQDWFASDEILGLAVLSAVTFVVFVVHELAVEHPLVNLRVLANRNFTSGLILITVLGGVLYGTTASLPLYLQTLMGYPALQAGLVLSPRGIAAFFMSMVAGRFLGKVDGRFFIAFGFCVLAYSSFLLGGISLQTSMGSIIYPTVINGFGISAIFVALTTATVSTLPQELMGDATGLYNLMRNLGGSVGISGITTLITRSSQAHQAMMVAHLTPYDRGFEARVHALRGVFTGATGASAAGAGALGTIYRQLLAQADALAYVDQFQLFGYLCLACLPLILMFKAVHGRRVVGAH